MIVHELERIARDAGLAYLEMDSSLTAEAFYRANGYVSLERGIHRLSGGAQMDCERMRKML
jgi:hypothetical protein